MRRSRQRHFLSVLLHLNLFLELPHGGLGRGQRQMGGTRRRRYQPTSPCRAPSRLTYCLTMFRWRGDPAARQKPAPCTGRYRRGLAVPTVYIC